MFKGYYKEKYYRGNMSDVNAEKVLQCLERDNVVGLRHIITNLDKEVVQEHISKAQVSLEAGERVTVKVSADELAQGTLKDEQTVGVAFMYFAGSCILGDEVGLGKTVQTAGLYNLLKVKQGEFVRCLFLTESVPAPEIQKKLVQFTGEYFHLIPTAEQRNVQQFLKYDADGLLNNCSVVATHALLNSSLFMKYCASRPFDLIVVDESWILKNKRTDVYINAKALLSTASRRILLNASTLELALEDVYAQFDIIDGVYLPTKRELKQQFHKEELVGGLFKTTGYKNTDNFKVAVRLRYLARTRVGLGANYEGNKTYCYSIPLTKAQRKLMSRTSLKRLVCDYPTGVDRHIEYNTENVSKLKVLLELLNQDKFKGKKVIVYSAYKGCQLELQEYLKTIGRRACVINGDVKQKDRPKLLEGYKGTEYDVLVTNIQRGLDLDCCDVVVIYSIDPNPQKMVQVEGRMTREFDVIGKTLILLVNAGHEQKKLQDIIQKRLQASNKLLTESASLLNVLLKSDIDFLEWKSDENKQ